MIHALNCENVVSMCCIRSVIALSSRSDKIIDKNLLR